MVRSGLLGADKLGYGGNGIKILGVGLVGFHLYSELLFHEQDKLDRRDGVEYSARDKGSGIRQFIWIFSGKKFLENKVLYLGLYSLGHLFLQFSRKSRDKKLTKPSVCRRVWRIAEYQITLSSQFIIQPRRN